MTKAISILTFTAGLYSSAYLLYIGTIPAIVCACMIAAITALTYKFMIETFKPTKP